MTGALPVPTGGGPVVGGEVGTFLGGSGGGAATMRTFISHNK